jgi:hypothetical protein
MDLFFGRGLMDGLVELKHVALYITVFNSKLMC